MTENRLKTKNTITPLLGFVFLFLLLAGQFSEGNAAYQPPVEPPEVNLNAPSTVIAGTSFTASIYIQNYPGSSYGYVQCYENGVWQNVKRVTISSSHVSVSLPTSPYYERSVLYRVRYRAPSRWIYSNTDSVKINFGRTMYLEGRTWEKQIRDQSGLNDYYASESHHYTWAANTNEISVSTTGINYNRFIGMSTTFVAQSTSIRIDFDSKESTNKYSGVGQYSIIYDLDWEVVGWLYFSDSTSYTHHTHLFTELDVGQSYYYFHASRDNSVYQGFTITSKNFVLDLTP